VEALLAASGPDAGALRAAGVVAGVGFVFVPRQVAAVEERRLLWTVWSGEVVELPEDGGEAPFEAAIGREAAWRLGFVRQGPRWVRVDVLEAARVTEQRRL
jgi:hypothetical protein